jgi:predicted metal-dependent hydrolase
VPARKKTNAGQHSIIIDGKTVSFDLLYSRRKTLTLRIHPDRRITVDAPTRTTVADVRAFVAKHGKWLLNKLAIMESSPVRASYQFVDGETFRYMGQSAVLRIEQDRIERVRLIDGTLYVGVQDPANRARIGQLIERWYRRRAKIVFTDLFKEGVQFMQSFGVGQPPLKLRLMRTRWGSCSSKGNITLNLKLIQTPEPLIRYVILHELCHLIEFNHSPRFWALMDHVMPGWKVHRKALKTVEVWDMKAGG